MIKEEIEQKIQNLRKKSRIITNCYIDSVVRMAEKVWTEDDSLLFSYDDHGVKRLNYFVMNTEQLSRLLLKPDERENRYILEFISRNKDENRNLLESLGYQNLANMMRMSNIDCSKILKENLITEYRDDSVGRLAEIDEAGEINRLLWSVFDTSISHLVSDIELGNSISNKELSIHRNENGVIDAVLQVVEQPRKFYINQVYNGTDKRIIHAMLQKRIHKYNAMGGKYLYAWVEENNIASVKFHQKYGMKHDGMWNLVYVLERKEKEEA